MLDLENLAASLVQLQRKDQCTGLKLWQLPLLRAFGQVGHISSTITASPEGYEVVVVSHVAATGGEFLFDNPVCQLLNNTTVLDEVTMNPYGFPGLNLWIANFEFIFLRPKLTKVTANFMGDEAIASSKTYVTEI